MKRYQWLPVAFGLALAVGGSRAAVAEVSETTTTTTTYSGTLTDVSPSSSVIVVRPSAAEAPKTYTYTKKTVFVDPSGNEVTAEVTRGQPVTIYYRQEGDTTVVEKVVMSKPRGVVTEESTEVHREIH
jgi:hypothetical protein